VAKRQTDITLEIREQEEISRDGYDVLVQLLAAMVVRQIEGQDCDALTTKAPGVTLQAKKP